MQGGPAREATALNDGARALADPHPKQDAVWKDQGTAVLVERHARTIREDSSIGGGLIRVLRRSVKVRVGWSTARAPRGRVVTQDRVRVWARQIGVWTTRL